MNSIKINKKVDDWIIVTYCDYGDANKKIIFRRSYSVESAKRWFEQRFHYYNCKGKWRIWQEDKKGKIINDSTKIKINKENKKDFVIATYCDYGEKDRKTIIRKSQSIKSATDWFKRKSSGFYNFGQWRVWQEDKQGNVINDNRIT